MRARGRTATSGGQSDRLDTGHHPGTRFGVRFRDLPHSRRHHRRPRLLPGPSYTMGAGTRGAPHAQSRFKPPARTEGEFRVRTQTGRRGPLTRRGGPVFRALHGSASCVQKKKKKRSWFSFPSKLCNKREETHDNQLSIPYPRNSRLPAPKDRTQGRYRDLLPAFHAQAVGLSVLPIAGDLAGPDGQDSRYSGPLRRV